MPRCAEPGSGRSVALESAGGSCAVRRVTKDMQSQMSPPCFRPWQVGEQGTGHERMSVCWCLGGFIPFRISSVDSLFCPDWS